VLEIVQDQEEVPAVEAAVVQPAEPEVIKKGKAVAEGEEAEPAGEEEAKKAEARKKETKKPEGKK